MVLVRRPEESKGVALRLSGGGAFQAEGTVGAEAPRWVWAWCFQRAVGRLEWLQQKELGGGGE